MWMANSQDLQIFPYLLCTLFIRTDQCWIIEVYAFIRELDVIIEIYNSIPRQIPYTDILKLLCFKLRQFYF